ncbi:MAG: methyltransferase domain-containing protein [Candidatus Melainabacteria bacterium]|nr:methyltransferase domain-containing protein [Candidatus Melainabacteria bacterium]
MTNTTKAQVAERFGRHAQSYSDSKGHSQGNDLDVLVDLLDPQLDWVVLDVATGAGHTAMAIQPHVCMVIATDLSEGMLQVATKNFRSRGLEGVYPQEADAEALPFQDDYFDAVTCRIAPHHFTDIGKALTEMARVLKPGGTLVIEDNIAMQATRLDRFINELEKTRDATHVRSYTKGEWRDMLREAGFKIAGCERYRKTHDVAEWVGMSDLDDASREKLAQIFAFAPQYARDAFEITYDDEGNAATFRDHKLIIKAFKK